MSEHSHSETDEQHSTLAERYQPRREVQQYRKAMEAGIIDLEEFLAARDRLVEGER